MISETDDRPAAELLRAYQNIVQGRHPGYVASWPLLNGWNLQTGSFKNWMILVFRDNAFSNVTTHAGLGEFPEDIVGVAELSLNNCDLVRDRLEKYLNIGDRDAICFCLSENVPDHELHAMLSRHERALGLSPMKIFLSHKGFDKPMVRQFKTTLNLLGFDPWLDEDAMPAGTNLQRGILQGFTDSCAAVFFVTAEFKDESFLATEVDYAVNEKQRKGDRFSIITLVFGEGTAKGSVPNLLHRYVWKEPKSELEALQEIIRALPILVGKVQWRPSLV